MKKNILIFTVTILLVFPALGGCSFRIKQVENIMRPPMLYGEYRDLQVAFQNAVGSDILLKSPENGEHRSAYVLFDIDGDTEDEAFVFYINQNDKTVAHMHILDYSGNNWVSIEDIAGAGSDIKEIAFTDMNGDYLPEVVVSWRLYENLGNSMLSIYKFETKKGSFEVRAVAAENCTMMKPLDVDSDGRTDIFLLNMETSLEFPTSSAKILKMRDDGKVILAGQVKLDGNIGSYASIKAEKASEGFPMRIYIDANKGKMQMITEVVFWDENTSKLVAPLLDTQTQSNIITWRNARIPSIDINNDGIIEIPTQSAIPGTDSTGGSTNTVPVLLTKWLQVKNSGLTVEVMRSIVNAEDDYMLILPTSLYNNISAFYDLIDRQMDIYSFEETPSMQGRLFFSIRAVPVSKWIDDKTVYNGYKKIMNNSGMVVGAYITQAGRDAGIDYVTLTPYIVDYEGA